MKYIALLFSGLLFQVHAAQDCSGTQTTSIDRFTLSANGYVVDNTTGLAWSRCLLGQQWNSVEQQCTGEAVRLTWQEALFNSQDFDLNQVTDWRLPNIKELASIVERGCVAPAANLSVFSATPATGNIWSATPNTSALLSDQSWAVDLSNGRLDSKTKNLNFYVRLVRYAE